MSGTAARSAPAARSPRGLAAWKETGRSAIRSWLQQAQSRPDLLPHPTDVPRCTAPGPDADRVLLLGAGPITGAGVLTHELALPGHLARALSAATGRGAIVDVVSDAAVTVTEAFADRDRLERYDAVVLAVGTVEALAIQPADRWRAGLARLLSALRAACSPSTVVALLPIAPLRHGASPLGGIRRLADVHADLLDRVSEELCAGSSDVEFIPAPRGEAPPTTSAAYGELAERVADALAIRLDRLAALEDLGTARAIRSRPDAEGPRQAAVDRTGLRSAPPLPQLDRLAQHARDLFGVSTAWLSLVDGDRVRHLASAGAPLDDAVRATAPCGRTIGQGGVLTAVGRDGAEIAPGGWRFYAGHPIESPDGFRIGALAIANRAARTFPESDRIALITLAGRVQGELWAAIDAARSAAAASR